MRAAMLHDVAENILVIGLLVEPYTRTAKILALLLAPGRPLPLNLLKSEGSRAVHESGNEMSHFGVLAGVVARPASLGDEGHPNAFEGYSRRILVAEFVFHCRRREESTTAQAQRPGPQEATSAHGQVRRERHIR